MSVATPYRTAPAGMVQLPMRPATLSIGRRIESTAVFAISFAAFALLGYWLIVQMRVVSFTSLAHLTGAYLSWHNDPPKLAAIGFNYPPLQTIVLLPFTIASSMATSLVALCLCSGLFGGLTMMTINRVLVRFELAALLRYVVLALVAATPTVAFSAADGGSAVVSLCLLAAAMSALVWWHVTISIRYLITSGLLFALAGLSDYAMYVWMALGGLMVAHTLTRRRAQADEVEGSMITYLSPSVYAFAMWLLLNALIVHSPFGWAASTTTGAVTGASIGTVPVDVGQSLVGALRLTWASSPLLLAVVPLLLATAVARRDGLAAWLAAFAVAAVLIPAGEALIYRNAAQLQLSKGLPMVMMSVLGMAYLYRTFKPLRWLTGLALVAGLAGSGVVVWNSIATYRYQDLERSFRSAVISGSSQEGARQPGGEVVGINQELAMADYIDTHVQRAKSILTDNSQTYGVILLSGDPALFRTRVDHGDASWLRQVRRPSRRVHYMLVAQNDPGDRISQTYPGASQGDVPGLTVVYSDARYTLLAVTPGDGVSSTVLRGDTTPSGIGVSGQLPTLPTLQTP